MTFSYLPLKYINFTVYRKPLTTAIADLSTAFPEFIATAAALTVDWLESYEEGLKQAEVKARELNELYNKVFDELAGKSMR